MAFLGAGAAQALTIDSFSDGDMRVDTGASATTAASSALGGWRTITVNSQGPGGADALVVSSPGYFILNTGALTTAVATITWDANGAGLGGVDFIEGLVDNYIAFDLVETDHDGVDFTFEFQDSLGNSSAVTVTNTSIGVNTLEYSRFSGIDFTSIDAMSLTIAVNQATDVAIKLLGTGGTVPLTGGGPVPQIPEPAPLLLLAGALLVLRLTGSGKPH